MTYFLFLLPVGFALFVSFMFRDFGRVLFTLLAAWWWPWRSDTAATLVADTLALDEDAADKMVAYYWWKQAQDARAALKGNNPHHDRH